MAGSGVVTFEEWVPQPRERVWMALTDPSLLARWWARGDIAPEVGHRFSMDMGAWGPSECRVLEVTAGESISYTFAEGSLDTTVTWNLESQGSGTRVGLIHYGFDLDSPAGRQAYEGMGSGWPRVMARISQALEEAETNGS
ncbi:MAG: SRPBCC domain-containing protein [Actinomycetota bacterium]|nr:SRPBCC domain-containing protein [Actinomycetota bacterium]